MDFYVIFKHQNRRFKNYGKGDKTSLRSSIRCVLQM